MLVKNQVKEVMELLKEHGTWSQIQLYEEVREYITCLRKITISKTGGNDK